MANPTMQATVEQEIERFLHTGERDMLSAAWPGNGSVAQPRDADRK